MRILFSDRTTTTLSFEWFDPDREPLKLIPIGGIQDRQVQSSAEVACYAGLASLRDRGLVVDGERFCIAYHFLSDGRPLQVLGESAGLAFCLNLAQEVLHRLHQQPMDRHMAATGIVREAKDSAAVLPVDHIEPKLHAAVDALTDGGTVYYPQANDHEIGPTLRTRAQERGVHLVPVQTVGEAIARYARPAAERAGVRARQATPRRSLALWGGIGIAAIVLAIMGLQFGRWTGADSQQALAERIVTQLESGAYADAKTLLQQTVTDGTLPTHQIENLREALDAPMEVVFELLPFKTQPLSLTSPATAPGTMPQLRSGEAYQLLIRPNRTCYVHVFQIDSKGQITVLFPYDRDEHKNPVTGKESLTLPASGKGYFLDQVAGQETLYLAASLWPSHDLDRLADAIRTNLSRPSELETQLLASLEKRVHAQSVRIGGVAFQKLTFLHE